MFVFPIEVAYLKFLDIYCLQECINFEINLKENYVILFHPAREMTLLTHFFDSLEINLYLLFAKDPVLVVASGPLNVEITL